VFLFGSGFGFRFSVRRTSNLEPRSRTEHEHEQRTQNVEG
jgi:hypothetical protein